MTSTELLEVVKYNIRNHSTGTASFGLLEYFSLTDIPPLQLAKIACASGNKTLARMLYQFDERNFWNMRELNLEKHIELLHSVKDHIITKEEKLVVADKLQEENFPLLVGTMFEGSRYFVCKGIDSLSKEKIRDGLLESYYSSQGQKKDAEVSKQSSPVLVKKR